MQHSAQATTGSTMTENLILYVHRNEADFTRHETTILESHTCVPLHRGRTGFYRSSRDTVSSIYYTNYFVIENLRVEDQVLLSLIGKTYALDADAMDDIKNGIYHIRTSPELFHNAVLFCGS